MNKYYPTEDTFLNASRGLIKGGEVRNIFGKAPGEDGVVTGGYRAPWELASDYVFPPSPLNMTVASAYSTPASDDGVKVLIKGLDSDYNEITEVATLNAATPYVTTQQFFRINDAVVILNNPLGNITVKNGSVTYAQINAGTGKNQAAIFTVPAGRCFYLYRIDAFATDSNGGKAAFFRNFVGNNGTGVEFRVAETQFFENMSIQRRFPFKYDEKQDIKLQLKSSSGSIDGSIFAEGLLLSEPLGG